MFDKMFEKTNKVGLVEEEEAEDKVVLPPERVAALNSAVSDFFDHPIDLQHQPDKSWSELFYEDSEQYPMQTNTWLDKFVKSYSISVKHWIEDGKITDGALLWITYTLVDGGSNGFNTSLIWDGKKYSEG